jgi:hypothetical protein
MLARAPGARRVVQRLRNDQHEMRLAIGRLETHLLDVRSPSRLEDAEFRVISQFGEDGIPDATITVPYYPTFVNPEKYYSRIYFGASLGTLVHQARQRGYRFVGCASNGAYAFFREDVASDQPDETARSGFRESRFLTGRTEDGTLSRERSVARRIALVGHLPVIDVTTDETTVAAAVGAAEECA